MTLGAGQALPSTQSHGHTPAVTSSDHAVAAQLSPRSVKRIAQGGAVVQAGAGARTGAQSTRVHLPPRKGSGSSKHSGVKVGKNQKALAEENCESEKGGGNKNEDDDDYDDMATGFLQFW